MHVITEQEFPSKTKDASCGSKLADIVQLHNTRVQRHKPQIRQFKSKWKLLFRTSEYRLFQICEACVSSLDEHDLRRK